MYGFGTPFDSFLDPETSFSNMSWPGSRQKIISGFYQVPHVREVYNRVCEAQRRTEK